MTVDGREQGFEHLFFSRPGHGSQFNDTQVAFLNEMDHAGFPFKVQVSAGEEHSGHSDGRGGEHASGLAIDIGFDTKDHNQLLAVAEWAANNPMVRDIGVTGFQDISHKRRALPGHEDHFHIRLNPNGQAQVKQGPATGQTIAASTSQQIQQAQTIANQPQNPAINNYIDNLPVVGGGTFGQLAQGFNLPQPTFQDPVSFPSIPTTGAVQQAQLDALTPRPIGAMQSGINSFLNQASFNIANNPVNPNAGIPNLVGTLGGGLANVGTGLGLAAATPFIPEATVPLFGALAGGIGSGSREARQQVNESGHITNPSAILAEGAIDTVGYALPVSKAASLGGRLAVNAAREVPFNIAGDLVSQAIRHPGQVDLNELAAVTALGVGGAGAMSLGRPGSARPVRRPDLDINPELMGVSRKIQTGGTDNPAVLDAMQAAFRQEPDINTPSPRYNNQPGQAMEAFDSGRRARRETQARDAAQEAGLEVPVRPEPTGEPIIRYADDTLDDGPIPYRTGEVLSEDVDLTLGQKGVSDPDIITPNRAIETPEPRQTPDVLASDGQPVRRAVNEVLDTDGQPAKPRAVPETTDASVPKRDTPASQSFRNRGAANGYAKTLQADFGYANGQIEIFTRGTGKQSNHTVRVNDQAFDAPIAQRLEARRQQFLDELSQAADDEARRKAKRTLRADQKKLIAGEDITPKAEPTRATFDTAKTFDGELKATSFEQVAQSRPLALKNLENPFKGTLEVDSAGGVKNVKVSANPQQSIKNVFEAIDRGIQIKGPYWARTGETGTASGAITNKTFTPTAAIWSDNLKRWRIDGINEQGGRRQYLLHSFGETVDGNTGGFTKTLELVDKPGKYDITDTSTNNNRTESYRIYDAKTRISQELKIDPNHPGWTRLKKIAIGKKPVKNFEGIEAEIARMSKDNGLPPCLG